MQTKLKNLKKIANRILEAIKNQEKIILYGDADPDGVCSVIILKESLEQLGLKPLQFYFPDREKEGYGITESALETLRKYSPALLITVDCGIGNVKEVELANKMGFEVIIIDHHEPLPEIPKAYLICDPKQEGDNYPFKDFATAGIVYKLAKDLFSLARKKYSPENFLELAAIATIADQMPIEGDNKKLVEEGILALEFTKRKSLRALIEINELKEFNLTEVRQKIISCLNSSGPEDHSNEAYLLLVEENYKKVKERVEKLVEKSGLRKKEIKRIHQEVEARIDLSKKIIFEGDENWPLVFLGPVASRVCKKYQKPTFLFKKGKNESPGAVRVPKGLDGVRAMISCEEILKTYGGHPLAAGFRAKNENLENFKKCLEEYFLKI